ncbi:EamA family transporter RarD [Campylobacter sp. faydin G-140]|uniref:EamA family transporter RarD n=1 Tax=Campylobacter anatolicus TaxID=2829105 RepID=UPI001B90B4EC|nr:EamA family transporter RarD [Campylobacter anatolicus]MBR8465973.1 EamA family transporter RarD [Campylobacter anatolicus]
MHLNDKQQGLIFAISAFVMWGFLPLFFNLFDKNVDAYEILAHRIIWSFLFLTIALITLKKFKNIKILLQNHTILKALFISGALISINWGVYVYGVNNGKILESSIGYFINPLMNMLFGVIFFKERLNTISKIAMFIVIIAIMVQIYALGRLPLIAIILPLSFALYGSVRKHINVAATDGLFIETLLISPIAIGYILYLAFIGQGHFMSSSNSILMIISGITTIIPLICFNAATSRINLSTIGYLQYISPTIGMLCAVFVFGENLDIYKIISFTLIWFALFLIGTNGFLHKFKGQK